MMNVTSIQPNVSVVIPYFQREAGILSRAVSSVIAQSYPGNIDIIVVDDGSPVAAHHELTWFEESSFKHPRHLEIVPQRNAGPAVARNTGLNRVADNEGLLAFLDSDDTWNRDHIERAVSKLALGHDFYFSDYLPLNSQRTAFQRDRFIPGEHGVAVGDDCYTFAQDFFDQTIRNNVVGTSTVVLRAGPLGALRFNPEYQYAGEDHIFWLGVSQITDRIVISARCEVEYHRGVNIYESGKKVADSRTFRRIANEVRFRKALPRLFRLNATQQLRNIEIIQILRNEFSINSIHALKTAPFRGLAETAKFIRKDIRSTNALWAEITKSVRRKIFRRSPD